MGLKKEAYMYEAKALPHYQSLYFKTIKKRVPLHEGSQPSYICSNCRPLCVFNEYDVDDVEVEDLLVSQSNKKKQQTDKMIAQRMRDDYVLKRDYIALTSDHYTMMKKLAYGSLTKPVQPDSNREQKHRFNGTLRVFSIHGRDRESKT